MDLNLSGNSGGIFISVGKDEMAGWVGKVSSNVW